MVNKEKNKTFIIDSRNRDIQQYPNPSNYKYHLDEPIKNASSIELISYYMPEFIYTINNNNNNIIIKIDSKFYYIDVPIGIYSSGCKLSKAINSQLKIMKIQDIYTEYIIHLRKILFILKNNIEIEIIFQREKSTEYNKNSIGYVLGFLPKTYTNYIGLGIIQKCLDTNNFILTNYNLELNKYLVMPDNDKISKINENLLLKINNKFIKVHITNNNTGGYYINSNSKIVEGKCQIYSNFICSTNMIDINPHKYVYLSLPNINRFENKTINTLTEIPLTSGISYNICGIREKINPHILLLKDIEIQFYPFIQSSNYISEDNLFDFQGANHVIILKIFYQH